VLIIFFGGSALSATRLNGVQWAISLTLGAISLPVAVIIRLIPNDFIRRFLPTSINHSLSPRIEDPNDDSMFDEVLGSLQASFRIRRNSRLSPLPVRFPKLRQIFSAFRERG
jgi:Ca2+-transporting ATPase